MGFQPYTSSRSGRFQWIMQRVSAVLLLALVFIHFIMQHFTAEAVTTGLTVSARFNDPYWQGFYVMFVVLGLYHGINGLIGIIHDYMPKPLYRGITAMVLWTVAVIFALIGINNIVSPQPLAEVKAHYADHGFSAGESRGNPPMAPAKTYGFRAESAELPLLRFYLEHHTNHNSAVEPTVIFGSDVQIPAEEAATIGKQFDLWANGVITHGPVSIEERDRHYIFSNTYEFAVWAMNVRHANAEARGDQAGVAPTPFSPSLY